MSRDMSNERARQMVAQETARIIVNQGIRDYRAAKIKAAERLGLNSRGSLPGNSEIERAIEDYHQIFGGASHESWLQTMRGVALGAMQLLCSFSPRLVGPVLNGTADENTAINLHVFADSAEEVAAQLAAKGINYSTYERRLKSRRDLLSSYPGYEFLHEGLPVQATIFPVDGIRQAPLSPVNGRPMQRAAAKQVAALTDSS